MPEKTFVIAQGGGPTAVINQTLVGAVDEIARRYPGARILGARHGVRGVRDGDYVNLSEVPPERMRAVGATPSAALGSTRDKPDAAYCDLVLKGLREVNADAFIYIGGNDTAGTQQILSDASGGSISFVHAPKTIDNDLVENDHTPGFMSAAQFVAGAFQSVDLDFRALPGIYVGIVMGRHAGFLTAAAAAWRDQEGDGPHLIYVPERAFEVSRFVDNVKETLARHGRCVVAVSEGVSTADGRALVESLVPPDRLERDQHGNIKLSGSDLPAAFERALAEKLPGKRARVDVLGYLPRGYIGAINPTDAEEAARAGAFAVEVAEKGGGSVALQEEAGRTVIRRVDLAAVAGKTRHMPDTFLHPEENRLSAAGVAYLNRLVPRKYAIGRPFV